MPLLFLNQRLFRQRLPDRLSKVTRCFANRKSSSKEKEKTIHSYDAVAAMMKRPDIVRRAFRGTENGIDIDVKMEMYNLDNK